MGGVEVQVLTDMDPNFCSRLRQSIDDLRQRGLTQAAKFSAEQLNSTPLSERLPPPSVQDSAGFNTSTPARSTKPGRARPSLSALSPSEFIPTAMGGPFDVSFDIPLDQPAEFGDPREDDLFELARTYFEARELERCAFVLNGAKGAKGRFLRLYATYLVCLCLGTISIQTGTHPLHRRAPTNDYRKGYRQ